MTSTAPRPLSDLAREPFRPRGLLFDLDDTFLTEGALTEDVYRALFSLKRAGLHLVAVTGRPLGWGEVLLPQWPIDAIVVENGALFLSRKGRAIIVDDPVPVVERRERSERLASIAQSVAHAFPSILRASDAWLRRTDVNWDIGETVSVETATVNALEDHVRALGALTARSSIHVHASFDETDKASGVLRALASLFSESESDALTHYAYVGDSMNDASCFARFAHSVGVRNVERHLHSLPQPPKFITSSAMSEGFVELAQLLERISRSHSSGKAV